MSALSLSAPALAPPAREAVRLDFESSGLGSRWIAQGEIRISRAEIPEPPDVRHGPDGSGARIDAGAETLFATRSGVLDADCTQAEAVRFWVHRSAEAAAEGDDVLELWLVVREDGRLVLATDCAALDAEGLAEHLGFLGEVDAPPRVLVFARDADYRAFPARYAASFASGRPTPESDGLTVRGVATGAWKESVGSLRPSYAHGVVPAWLTRAGRLANYGEWLQEGIATRYQLRFHPQANAAGIVREGLALESHREPLA